MLNSPHLREGYRFAILCVYRSSVSKLSGKVRNSLQSGYLYSHVFDVLFDGMNEDSLLGLLNRGRVINEDVSTS